MSLPVTYNDAAGQNLVFSVRTPTSTGGSEVWWDASTGNPTSGTFTASPVSRYSALTGQSGGLSGEYSGLIAPTSPAVWVYPQYLIAIHDANGGFAVLDTFLGGTIPDAGPGTPGNPQPGDLVTTSEALAALMNLSPAQIADLPSKITAVSRTFERYCMTGLAAGAYDEVYSPENRRTIRLNNGPLLELYRISAGLDGVLLVANNAGVQRATVQLTTVGEAASLIPTGLRLTSVAAGVPTVTDLSLASYPTVATLAAAVAAVPGWTATVRPSPNNLYAGLATADLRPPQGTLGAVLPAGGGPASPGATLWMYTRDLWDFDADERRGRIQLYEGWHEARRYPDRTWAGDPRRGRVRVQYRAGYITIPADLKAACIAAIRSLYDQHKYSGMTTAERWVDYQYTLDPLGRGWSQDVISMLAPYRRLAC